MAAAARRAWSTVAAGSRWSGLAWGEPGDPAVVLIHGITSASSTWWWIGPGIAAAGRRVIAVDLPGHGGTQWRGRHRFRDTAADLAALLGLLGLKDDGSPIVAHSWGAMVTASLPGIGIERRPLILIDPPTLDAGQLEEMSRDPEDMPLRSVEGAAELLRAAHPDWGAGDIQAKAENLAEFDRDAVRSILLGNGEWDSGFAAVAAAGATVWLIRGDPATGGLTPDAVAARFAERFGADHVTTIPGAPHGPHRTHPAETLAAILRAVNAAASGAADEAIGG